MLCFVVLLAYLEKIQICISYFVCCVSMMQRYFLFAFVPFLCYCVIFTHIYLIPFLCCVRTQTKLNCVRTQCVIFDAGI